MHTAARFIGPGQPYEGLAKRNPTNWTGAIRLVPEKLAEPLTWRKPARVFVNSMSDLFHEDVPDEFIDKVFGVMAKAYWHTFQVLTKRADRMAVYFADPYGQSRRVVRIIEAARQYPWPGWAMDEVTREDKGWNSFPYPNIHLGVSVEDRAAADARIPHLLATPAAVRFLSVEPLLGDIDLTPWLHGEAYGSTAGKRGGPGGRMVIAAPSPVNWVIVGGESGTGARPCDIAWIRSIVGQCKAAGTSVFVKQLGGNLSDRDSDECSRLSGRSMHDRKGGDPLEWAPDLRVREFPTVSALKEVAS